MSKIKISNYLIKKLIICLDNQNPTNKVIYKKNKPNRDINIALFKHFICGRVRSKNRVPTKHYGQIKMNEYKKKMNKFY